MTTLYGQYWHSVTSSTTATSQTIQCLRAFRAELNHHAKIAQSAPVGTQSCLGVQATADGKSAQLEAAQKQLSQLQDSSTQQLLQMTQQLTDHTEQLRMAKAVRAYIPYASASMLPNTCNAW